MFFPGTQHARLVLKLQRTDASKSMGMCLSNNLTETFLNAASVCGGVSNLLRFVPPNRDGTKLPTTRLGVWEAPLGLGCPEALKKGPHIGSLKGKSSVSGGNQ